MMALMAKLYMGLNSLFHHGPNSSSDPGMNSAIRSSTATKNENLHFSWA